MFLRLNTIGVRVANPDRSAAELARTGVPCLNRRNRLNRPTNVRRGGTKSITEGCLGLDLTADQREEFCEGCIEAEDLIEEKNGGDI